MNELLRYWAFKLCGKGEQEDAASDVMTAAATEIERLRAENARLREALKNLLDRDERNTCQHEETHRGGFLWEICDVCGAKWADDMGGKTEWKDPPEWVAARDALEVKP
jgi:rubrerythrin